MKRTIKIQHAIGGGGIGLVLLGAILLGVDRMSEPAAKCEPDASPAVSLNVEQAEIPIPNKKSAAPVSSDRPAPIPVEESVPETALKAVEPPEESLDSLIGDLRQLAATEGMSESTEQLVSLIAARGNAALEALHAIIQSDAPVAERELAARALAANGSPEAVRVLLEQLLAEASPDVRDRLARTLQLLEDSAAAPTLIAVLGETVDHPRLQMHISDALGRIADEAAAQLIVDTVHSDDVDADHRRHLLQTMAGMSNTSAIPVLAMIAWEDPDPDCRDFAAIALGSMGEQDAVDSLAMAIEGSGQTNLTCLLVQSLGAVDNKESIGRMIQLFQASSNPAVKYAAATALSRIDPAGHEFGLTSLHDKGEEDVPHRDL